MAQNFVFQERDLELLSILNQLKFLKTDQVKRLFFNECKSLQAPRKRLRILTRNGYIQKIRPLVKKDRKGNIRGSVQDAFTLTQKGIDALTAYHEDKGEEFKPKNFTRSSKIANMFLNHSLDISDFCVNLMLVLKDHQKLYLDKLIIDSEIKSHMMREKTRNRYRLYDEVEYQGETIEIYPDIMFILQGKEQYKSVRFLYFVEIDRGTENLQKIRNKVIGYNFYKTDPKKFNKYKKYGVNTFNKVLFSAISEKRSLSIRKTLNFLEGREFVWVSDFNKTIEDNILNEKIWLTSEGDRRSIIIKN